MTVCFKPELTAIVETVVTPACLTVACESDKGDHLLITPYGPRPADWFQIVAGRADTGAVATMLVSRKDLADVIAGLQNLLAETTK